MKTQEWDTVRQGAGEKRRAKRRGGMPIALSLVISLLAVLLATAGPAGAAEGQRFVVGEGESIQAAIDAAEPGATIVVRGDHTENVWVNKDGITLIGRNATLRPEADPGPTPCSPDPTAPAPIVCVTPVSEGPPAAADYLDGFTMRGFDVIGGDGDGIATVFVNNVNIRKNTITDAGCGGIFVIFSTGFAVVKNEVSGSGNGVDGGCPGMGVFASTNGHIRNNTSNDNVRDGIALGDTSNVVVRKNSVSGNCFGISVTEANDGGNGVRAEDFPGENIRIVANTASANDRTCPFGPDVTIGLAGIVAAGVDNVVIRNNVANNNGSAETTPGPGGIVIVDFPEFDGSMSPTTNIAVVGNEATGNTAAGEPLDLLIVSDFIRKVTDNTCGVSAPDPTWCS